MTTIVGLSGSLRKGSINSSLLRHAAEVAPSGTQIDIVTIGDIPLYNGDVEASDGIPAPATALKDRIAEADGLLIATPEYSNSMPGVLKNTFDWLARPPDDAARVFGGKPVAVMGATPGGFGTRLAQNAWLPVLRILGTKPYFGGRLEVARGGQVFDENGAITDEETLKRLRRFIEGFAKFVRDPE